MNIGTVVTLKNPCIGSFAWQSDYFTYGKLYKIIDITTEAFQEDTEDAIGNVYTETFEDTYYVLLADNNERHNVYEADFTIGEFCIWTIVEPKFPQLIKLFLIHGLKPTIEMLEKSL